MRGEIRTGRVSSTDSKRHTAQVQLVDVPEDDPVVTYDLQVLITRPGDYSLPDNNTPVLCLLLDGARGAGYVLGAIYTEDDAAPTDDAARRVVAGDDVRLGAFDASDKVALGPKVKSELDKIKNEFTTIKTTLDSLAGQAAFGTPYAAVGYSPSEPSAEKVSAK